MANQKNKTAFKAALLIGTVFLSEGAFFGYLHLYSGIGFTIEPSLAMLVIIFLSAALFALFNALTLILLVSLAVRYKTKLFSVWKSSVFLLLPVTASTFLWIYVMSLLRSVFYGIQATQDLVLNMITVIFNIFIFFTTIVYASNLNNNKQGE